MKSFPTRKSFSDFTSAAIRSTHMPTFLQRRNYRSIASLGELDDRAQFKIAGAIVEVEKKFTRKEGKPFAVVLARRSDGHARGGRVERGLSEGLGYSRARARC